MSNLMCEAGVCKNGESHATRVSSTQGKIRYCVCDTCGASWQVSGPYADEAKDFLSNLANALREAKPATVKGQTYVVLLDADVKDLVKRMDGIVSPGSQKKERNTKVSLRIPSMNGLAGDLERSNL